MSFQELKDKVLSLSPEERSILAELLQELNLKDDPNYLRGLEAEIVRMEQGEKFSSAQVYALHDRLNSERK